MTANPKSANDNGPASVDDFPDLASRRAWLASLPMPANDSDIPPVLGCPTLARLSNAGDEKRASALATWLETMRPTRMPGGLNAANDNGPTEEGWERAAWAPPKESAEVLDTDRLLDVRPTVFELLAAVGRVSVSTKRSADGKWSAMERRPTQLVIGRHRGTSRRAVSPYAIVGWFDRNGVERRADESLAQAKGGTKKARTTADIRRYLDRPGSPFPPQRLARDGGRYWGKTEQAAAAHLTLAQLGVDGSVPAEQLSCPPTRCPTAIAKGAHWFGGLVVASGKSVGMDASVAEQEIARLRDVCRLRDNVGARRAKLLDLATTRMTSGEIGAEFGYRGKYTERWAVTAINEALDNLAA